MTMSLLLVHSPLVGPSSWAPLAARAIEHGHAVAVPDLTQVGEAEPPQWEAFAATAVLAGTSLEPPIAVFGHSGAGVFLPEVGRRLGDRMGAMIFVDAVVPRQQGFHHTASATRKLLDEQTTDGALSRWLEWWPAEVVAALLPNPADRATLLADMPVLPRAFYDEAVPVPDEWSDGPCGYLKLSNAYDFDFDEAGNRGWFRSSIDATHLSIYTEPEPVLAAASALVDQIALQPGSGTSAGLTR